MLLAEVAQAWHDVAATRSRKAKTARLVEVLTALADEELAAGTAMLAGELRHGRIGVGWRAVSDVDAPPATSPTLVILDVDEVASRIADESGAGSVARRAALLEDLFARATAVEQDYLRGVLLGNLRQGALEGVVLQAVAEAADVDLVKLQRAAMLAGDVTAASVTAMTEGAAGLSAYRLERFRPVLPMLASSAPTVGDALAITGEALVDTKLDGMRLQLHVDDDRVATYTRSLREVRLPAVVAAVRAAGLPPGIYDGEALATDADDRPLPFQDQISEDTVMRPHLFDVLQLGDEDVMDRPLGERADLLAEVAGGLLVGRVRTDDVATAEDHFRAAIESGHEGVVVKDVTGTWEAGRRGKGWVKVKPVHTVDLVVIAVEWGSGRRKGWLSNLHLAAPDDDGTFVMLGKTFKGMTDEMLEWQTARFLELETGRDGHVVHVRPEQVVEIAFDGVQRSSRYPGGMALRFARVKRYRDDKTPADADSLATIRAIHEGRILPELP